MTTTSWDNVVEDIGPTASQSCRRKVDSGHVYMVNGDCPVLCGITPLSGRRRMQCLCMFVRIVTLSLEPPAEFFFQLRLAEQYFRLIFGSAGFTRTGENVAELRLVAQFAATIRLKQ